jgi:two-component sensor histidine kinase
MVLNELLLNAAEHAFDPGSIGEVVVSASREKRHLYVSVADDGRGLPPDFDADSAGRLGLQIVRTLVTGELRGTIDIRAGADGGTEASLVFPLDKR